MNLDVRAVPISYLDNIDFYDCIKRNIELAIESYEFPELIKQTFIAHFQMIPGLYKRREKKGFIKKEKKRDFCLLLTELLHSISIMQHHKEIEDWINEGLTHYLTKILCKKCEIKYIQSEHQKYFEIWKKIHQKYGLEVLLTLLKSQDIRITKKLLNYMFNYEKDDILEISFEKARELLKNLD